MCVNTCVSASMSGFCAFSLAFFFCLFVLSHFVLFYLILFYFFLDACLCFNERKKGCGIGWEGD